MIATISERGQITIPKKIRNKFSSNNLEIFYKDGNVILRPVLIVLEKNIPEKKEDDLENFNILGENSLKELWDNKEDDIYADFYLKK